MEEIILNWLNRLDAGTLIAMAGMFWIFKKHLDKKFEKIDEQFEKIDKEFEKIDKEFVKIR